MNPTSKGERMAENVSERDLGYTAGIVDGEGSISMTSAHSVRVAITMTDSSAIRAIQGWFGGSLYLSKLRANQQRAQRTLVYNSKEAETFLRVVRPCLRVKAVLADVALEFFDGPEKERLKFGRRNEEQTLAAEECYWKLRVLNGSANFGDAKGKMSKDALGQLLNEVQTQVAINEDGEMPEEVVHKVEQFLKLVKEEPK